MNVSLLYRIIFLLSVFLIIGCTPEKPTTEESKIKFDFFNNKNNYSHKIIGSHNDNVFVTFPGCMAELSYYNFSFTNQNNLECFEKGVYFSIDEIEKKSINNLFSPYFSQTDEKADTLHRILESIYKIRSGGLHSSKTSFVSTIQTQQNKTILMGSVLGNLYKNDNNALYQYGIVELNDAYYILQVITRKENASFLMDDFLKIFKSIRLVKK